MGRILLRILVGDISGAEEIEGLGVEDKMRLQEEEATKTIFQMKFRSKSFWRSNNIICHLQKKNPYTHCAFLPVPGKGNFSFKVFPTQQFSVLCPSWSHQLKVLKEERYLCRHLIKIRTKTLNLRWLSLNICPTSTTAFVLPPPLSSCTLFAWTV